MTTVGSGQSFVIRPGKAGSSITVLTGGVRDVDSGGTSNTVIDGGTQNVSGIAVSTTINGGPQSGSAIFAVFICAPPASTQGARAGGSRGAGEPRAREIDK
jgi:autotransporter passenger strand-loop-strand repeat protein